jgi:hypothetical protein
LGTSPTCLLLKFSRSLTGTRTRRNSRYQQKIHPLFAMTQKDPIWGDNFAHSLDSESTEKAKHSVGRQPPSAPKLCLGFLSLKETMASGSTAEATSGRFASAPYNLCARAGSDRSPYAVEASRPLSAPADCRSGFARRAVRTRLRSLRSPAVGRARESGISGASRHCSGTG